VSHFAVSVVGRDRPGIVAALAEALLALDANIEDSRMTILRGHFAMMLVVSVPGEEPDPLRVRLEAVREQLALESVTVAAVDELEAGAAEPTHVVSVYGSDHPGIVREISVALAERGVNITDLQTRLAGSEAAPLYVMMLEVEAGDADIGGLAAALAQCGERARVEVSLAELGSDAL
jgi:glycine cleavage system transcriptional repressor